MTYPDDILKAAREAYHASGIHSNRELGIGVIAAALYAERTNATEAERERAAKIVFDAIVSDDETDISEAAADAFNDRYRNDCRIRLAAVGNVLLAAIRGQP